MPNKRLPFVADYAQRGINSGQPIDAQGLNMIPEKDGNGMVWSFKRPGLYAVGTMTSGTAFQGSFVGPSDTLMVLYSSVLQTLGGPTLSISGLTSLLGYDTEAQATSSTPAPGYAVVTGAGAGAYQGLFVGNSNPTSAAVVAGPSGTGTLVPGVVQLDGTFYVMDTAGGIWNSNVNDPTTGWGTGYRYANAVPGTGVALTKQLAYVVALKTRDVEFFYDAGNPAGSPLSPVQSARLQFGCYSATSIATHNDTLFWIAQGDGGELFVVEVRNLQATKISTPAIDRVLGVPSVAGVVRVLGHTFYALGFHIMSGLSIVGTRIYAYEVDLKIWVVWEFPQIIMGFATDIKFQTTWVFDNTNKYYGFDTAGMDDGTLFTWQLTTPPFDGDSRLRKYLSRMDILTDNTATHNLQVRWSDDDQVSWSSWRNVNLQSSRPSLTGCGTFRRRTFQFRHIGPENLRLQGVDLWLEEGTL